MFIISFNIGQLAYFSS